MKTEDIKRLGLILAVQAEIDGMKAHNKWCKTVGKNEMYSDSSFFKKAEEIREIVNKHDDQL